MSGRYFISQLSTHIGIKGRLDGGVCIWFTESHGNLFIG